MTSLHESQLQRVEVCAPSRLHFGLLSFGQPACDSSARQFAGCGAMLDQPSLKIRVSKSGSFSTDGAYHERIAAIATHLAKAWQLEQLPECKVDVITAPPQHTGLGTGTQLSLSVVAGIAKLFDRPWQSAEELSQWAGRGKRSAIGTHGFLQGGLISDGGKHSNEPLGKLNQRIDLPKEWRFVLIQPASAEGLAGPAEISAFQKIRPPTIAESTALGNLIENDLFPAAAQEDFDRFSATLYEYGYRAGMMFANVQGGPFASEQIAKLVELVRSNGIEGVGQSSWGPTVYCLAKDEPSANELADVLQNELEPELTQVIISAPNNRGATISKSLSQTPSGGVQRSEKIE